MLVLVREINYKMVEVSDDIPESELSENLRQLIEDCEVVIGDTTESTYEYQTEENKASGKWSYICGD